MGDIIPGLPDDLAMECLIRMHFESFANVVLTCKKWKHKIGSPEYLRRRIVGGYSQSIVVMGQAGFDFDIEDPGSESQIMRFVICELKTRNWRELPPIPGYIKAFPSLAVAGFNLVVIAGWLPRSSLGPNEVFIYSFISNAWRRGADMLDSRQYCGCASDSDRMVYVVGGFDGKKFNRMMSALAYDVAKDEWVRLPDVATEVGEGEMLKATFQSGKLHFFGIYSLNLYVQSFDPTTWTWDPVCKYLLDSSGWVERPRIQGGVGNVHVCGDGVVAVIENGKFRKVADLPINFDGLYNMMKWNKHLIVIGYMWDKPKNIVCSLDLESKEWSILESPRSYCDRIHCASTSEI